MLKSILVTGGAGFIGSHVVDKLLQDRHMVTVIDNFNDFYDPAIKRHNIEKHRDHAGYTLIEGDIRDSSAVAACFRKGAFNEIIHIAAMAGVRPSIANPVLYQEVNIIGTMNLLEACRHYGVNRFIFTSSSSVYGNSERVPFSETDPADRPISPYASTKRACELMIYTYHHLYGIKAVCLRLFTVYGPRQRPEMAISLFADRIYRGKEIRIFGDGSSGRDYTYIEDIVAGIMKCRTIDFNYEIFNLGRSDTVRLDELVHKIETYLGKKARIVSGHDQPGDVRQTFADISRARRSFGYDPQTSIDDGLRRFIDWYIKERAGK